MSNENLKLWDACKSIETRHLKAAKVNGNQCTSVNGLEMVRIFTENFGPIGKNWRYEIAEERMDEVKPMQGVEPPLMELNHTVKLRFWIRYDDGEWSSFEQYGHTKARYMTGKGFVMFDEEYAKKSTTDALKKCLSLLGVAADVYTGQIDDHQYMAEVADQMAVKAADENVTKRLKEEADIADRLEDAIKCIESASDEAQAKRMIREHRMRISGRIESRTLGKMASAALNKIEHALLTKFPPQEEK